MKANVAECSVTSLHSPQDAYERGTITLPILQMIKGDTNGPSSAAHSRARVWPEQPGSRTQAASCCNFDCCSGGRKRIWVSPFPRLPSSTTAMHAVTSWRSLPQVCSWLPHSNNFPVQRSRAPAGNPMENSGESGPQLLQELGRPPQPGPQPPHHL